MAASLSEIHAYLESVEERLGYDSTDPAIRNSLSELKLSTTASGEDDKAKALWCLEQTLEVQTRYLRSFDALKSHNFYQAWCELERAEVALYYLKPHQSDPPKKFRIDFIRTYVPKWQSLFPYKVFLSPELLEHEKKCSICGEIVRPRSPCGHRPGEIYGGQLCLRIVTKAEPLGVGLVEHPVQKYSVPFLNDPATNKPRDHYNYAVAQYAVDRLDRPFHEWNVEKTTRIWPHSRFRHIGRNDPCPCDSAKKYKKCCLNKEGVIRPHFEFKFAIPPPVGLGTEVYIS